jgi:hypothetical protein
MRNGGGLGGIGRQHRQHDLSVQRTQRCIAENITDVIDHFHLSMKTFSTAKKITFTDHVNRGIFEKIRNVPQTIFKPSVHHSSRFFGKLFGAIGDAVFVVGFGAAHNETLGVAKKKNSNHNNIPTTSQQHPNNITTTSQQHHNNITTTSEQHHNITMFRRIPNERTTDQGQCAKQYHRDPSRNSDD